VTTGISATHDFRGLAELRADAARQSPEAAREAARQFEALFVQMMLKSMRDANAVLGEERDRTYEEMFDQQVALEMTRGKGLGLADMLVRQLQLNAADASDAAAVASTGAAPSAGPLAAPGAPAAPGLARDTGGDFRPASRLDFVRSLWPHAEQAGRELGVDPRVIVAQAALETGWGSRQMRTDDGRSTFNLFGIKADARWTGARVGVTTLEYDGGVPAPTRAQFRAYGSLGEGVADYVRFLKANGRYAAALADGSRGGDFAAGLQAAGYATDPAYADKIRGILASPGFDAAITTLKAGAAVPTDAAGRG
jgi:flagellar protein FlgJ